MNTQNLKSADAISPQAHVQMSQLTAEHTNTMYTLIPTVYRALLTSAVLGTDHRIHTTKETQCHSMKAINDDMLWHG